MPPPQLTVSTVVSSPHSVPNEGWERHNRHCCNVIWNMRPLSVRFRAPMLLTVLSLLSCPRADAQYVVNIERMSPAMQNFEWRPDDQALNCSVSAIRPALNYGFRF